MKKALKIIIPLALVAILLIGAALFFFVFRPDLTCRFCVSRAEAALARERPARAVTWYDRAWDLCPEDMELAIDLADAYKRSGNYTKAEYTLVSAISRQPDDLQLYLELSRTYVEQDKLLDADQMLSRTANESIQQQLSALRPAAPVIQPEGGAYNEYVDVSLSYGGGAAYLSIDGDYPSLSRDAYTGPLSLEAGESTVMAVVVSDDGLVSPVATAGYTIGGIVEEITLTDPAVEATIREVLGKTDGSSLLTSDLWALTTLELPSDVSVLTDLIECRGLTELTLHDAYGVDLSVLGQLTALETLDLSHCTVSSGALEAIATLPSLRSLNLSGCALTDISDLASLTTLETLDLSDNVLSELDGLSGLSNLKDVKLANNTVSSIAPLAGATGLESLDISGNQVSSLSPLGNKASLRVLLASDNEISDLSPLTTSNEMEEVDVSHNYVEDLGPLSLMGDLSILKADYNAISELPDMTYTALSQLSLSHNQLSALPDMTDMTALNFLNVDYNAIRDLTVLAECPALVQVDAFANPVGDTVDPLTEHSIIVNYDPTYTLPEEEAEGEESEE